jgi:hypothetical protein
MASESMDGVAVVPNPILIPPTASVTAQSNVRVGSMIAGRVDAVFAVKG